MEWPKHISETGEQVKEGVARKLEWIGREEGATGEGYRRISENLRETHPRAFGATKLSLGIIAITVLGAGWLTMKGFELLFRQIGKGGTDKYLGKGLGGDFGLGEKLAQKVLGGLKGAKSEEGEKKG